MVKFSVSISSFNADCFSFKLGESIEFFGIEKTLTIKPWFNFVIGALIGIGIVSRYSFNDSTSMFSFIAKFGFIAGGYFGGVIDIKQILN